MSLSSPRGGSGEPGKKEKRLFSKKDRRGLAASKPKESINVPSIPRLAKAASGEFIIPADSLGGESPPRAMTERKAPIPLKSTFGAFHRTNPSPSNSKSNLEHFHLLLDGIYNSMGLDSAQRLRMFNHLDEGLRPHQHSFFTSGTHLPPATVSELTSLSKQILRIVVAQQDVSRVIRLQAWVRRWSARRVYLRERDRLADAKLRNLVFGEILVLERSYCHRLDTFIQNYLQPLRRSPIKGIGVGSIAEIFSNLEDIHQMHVKLCQELEQLPGDPYNPFFLGIADVFLGHSDVILPQYESYVENYHVALNTIDQLSQDVPKFAAFLEERRKQASGQEPDMMVCRDALSMPLQHLTKWGVLISRVIEYSRPESSLRDYEQLVSAATIINKVSDIIEIKLHTSLMNAKMLAIQRRIESDSPLNLTGSTHRVLVKEGAVSKVDDKKAMYLFLFSDVLIVTESHSAGLKFSKRLELGQDTRLRDPTKERSKFVFYVSTGEVELKIAAKSGPEKGAWMADIVTLIHGFQKKRVFGVPLGALVKAEQREIPYVCEKAFADLRARALGTEGIFRVPGDAKVIKDLKVAFDTEKGHELVFDQYPVHDVGGVLKLFFREMPNPLFPFASFATLLGFYTTYEKSGESEEAASAFLKSLAKLVASLPVPHRVLLKHLVEFLAEIVARSQENMMNARNVAVVFAPNVIRPLEDTMETALLSPQVSKVLCFLIENNGEAFWSDVDCCLAEGNSFEMKEELTPLPAIKLVQTDSPLIPRSSRREKLMMELKGRKQG